MRPIKRTASHLRGFTLVEILVSTTIFLLATTAILAALIAFLRAQYSYSQTAYFSSTVRLKHERMMQDLRNTSSVLSATADSVKIVVNDLQGNAWTVEYYGETTANGIRLMRKVVETGAVSEVYDKLASYTFTYYDRHGENATSTPSALTSVKALRLAITPRARSKMLIGKDVETISDNAGTLSNAIVHFRNS